ncbi:MAG: hypothetical protein ACK50P_02125 [Planctomycetaceae bacterium]
MIDKFMIRRRQQHLDFFNGFSAEIRLNGHLAAGWHIDTAGCDVADCRLGGDPHCGKREQSAMNRRKRILGRKRHIHRRHDHNPQQGIRCPKERPPIDGGIHIHAIQANCGPFFDGADRRRVFRVSSVGFQVNPVDKVPLESSLRLLDHSGRVERIDPANQWPEHSTHGDDPCGHHESNQQQESNSRREPPLNQPMIADNDDQQITCEQYRQFRQGSDDFIGAEILPGL